MNAGIFLVQAVHEIAIATECAIAAKASEEPDSDPLPYRPALNARANGVYTSNDLMPRNAREIDREKRLYGRGVRMADTTCLDSDTHLTRTRITQVAFLTSENFPGPESSMALYVVFMEAFAFELTVEGWTAWLQ